jgi:hypothetical protein
VGFSLFDPRGGRVIYDLQNNFYRSTLRQGFVNVAGNVEVAVVPLFPGAAPTFRLAVADVPARARGGAVYFGIQGNEVRPLTGALRAGTTDFRLTFGTSLMPPPSPPPAAPGPDSTTTALAQQAGGPRTNTTVPVLQVSPFVRIGTPESAGGQGTATSPADTKATVSATALSGGSSNRESTNRQALVQRLMSLLNRMAGPWQGLVDVVQAILRAMPANPKEDMKPPAGDAPNEKEKREPPPKEENELFRSEAEILEPEELSLAGAVFAACSVSAAHAAQRSNRATRRVLRSKTRFVRSCGERRGVSPP